MIAVIPRTTCRSCLYSDPCLDINGKATGRGGCRYHDIRGRPEIRPTNLKLDRPRRCSWYERNLPA